MYLRNSDAAPVSAWQLRSEQSDSFTRRDFLRLTTIAGAGLTVGAWLPARAASASAGDKTSARGNSLVTPFVHVNPDNTVTVIIKHVEAGQGVWTGLPAVVADELDASWDQMRIESAPAQVPQYGNLEFDPKGNMQGTGGSTSMANSWDQLRQAGAAARAMLVQAAAVRWQVPPEQLAVSDGIVSHPSGKHASFGELAASAGKLPVPRDLKLKDPAQFKYIGRDKLPRLDSRAKSTGTQQFAIDVMLPDMMTAVLLRPPRFGGKVQSIDAGAARTVPGVVDVVQVPRGVAVVACDMWSAKQGRDALKVVWDESAAEKRSSAELSREFRQLRESSGALQVEKRGNPEQELKNAAKVIELEFEYPYLAHAPMEPLTAACRLSAERCEIWAGCQFHTVDQMNAATAAGLKPDQVFINTLAAGGSFGRRATPDSDYIAEVVSIAKATGGRYPVKLVWTREDDVTGGRYRPATYHHIRAGLTQNGQLLALEQRIVGQSILANTPLASMMKDGIDSTAVEGNLPEQYGIEHALVTWTPVKVGVPVLWWRSVGHSHSAHATEVAIDEIAAAAGKDPVAFRLALLEKKPRSAGALKLAAEKAGWDAAVTKGGGRGRGVAVHESFNSAVAYVVEVTVAEDRVRVDRVVCAVDCGIAVTPDVIRAQMQSGIGYGLSAALYGRITLTDGRVDQSNFHQYRVLRINEMPRLIEVYIVPSAEKPTGVGEPGTPPIAPAVANAVRAATGIRLHTLPFDLAAAKARKA